MNWLTAALGSSVGKKLMMALTGLAFTGFLAGHLAGNLTIYGGKAAFNGYAEKLHALGPLLKVFELGLITFAAVHILTGLWLFLQNRKARPVRYTLDTSPGGRTLSSRTMPYTGLIILAFVVFHLANFTFADKTKTTIFDIVSAAFASPIYVGIYVAAMIVVGVARPARVLERLPDPRRQPPEAHAGDIGPQCRRRPDRRFRLRPAADFHFAAILAGTTPIERNPHAP